MCLRASAGEIHPKFRAPAHAIVAQAIWSGVLVLSGTLSQLVNYTGFAVVLFSAIAVAAVFVLRRRQPDEPRPFKAWGYPWAPAIFVIASAAMLASILWNTPLDELHLGLRRDRRGPADLLVDAAGRRSEMTESRPGATERVSVTRIVEFLQIVRPTRRLRQPLQFALEVRRLVELDPNVEDKRLETCRAHFDPVRTGFDVQPLEHAVEVVDDAGVIAVHEHLRVARLDLQAQIDPSKPDVYDEVG